MKYTKLYLLFILVMFMAHTTVGQTINFKTEDCVKGKVRIKLKQDQLKSANAIQSLSGTIEGTDIGIIGIDEISRNVGIKRIKRVFPFSLKNEEKHRKYGLHLWIELEFDENIDPLNVVEKYKGLADLEIVKPVIKKVSLDSDKKAVPYKVEVLSKSSATIQGTLKSAAADYTPFFDDPLLQSQWHYENDGSIGDLFLDTDLFEAWKQTTGSSDIIVAVVDQGIDVYHEDLNDNIWQNEAEINGEEGVDDDQNGYIDDFYGYNFIMDGALSAGDHGTHVAGTVGAVSNNGIGVAGVAGGNGSGNGVKLISCQVFDYRANGGLNFAEAIIYGADNGAVISQNSWGYDTDNYFEPEVLEAINYFIAEAGQYEGSPMKGGILFFAAGNTQGEMVRYPGAFDQVVAVSALSADGLPAPYTTYGDWVDISALGGDQTYFGDEGGVLSTLPNNEYGFMEGTSMACPHVSGVAALVISKYGGADFTPDDLRRIILNSSNRFIFQHNNKYGKGYLSAESALADDNRIPPMAITDLRAANAFHDEIRLEWTVPVDEDNGEPRFFYFAISEEEITDANFENKGLFLLENEQKAGEIFNIAIGGLQKETNYWFAVKSADRFENISQISNILKTKTSRLPHFMESTRLVDVTIDLTQDSVKKVPIGLSNIGDGIIYYNTTVSNEEYYFEEQQEDISTQIEEKAAAAAANASLFETTQSFLKPIAQLKSALSVAETDHWAFDRTEYVSGMGYHDETIGPSNLLGSGNTNAGLITAVRFDIPYDYSFNLTHIEAVLLPEINDKPIIIEIKKGSKYVEEAQTVYLQEYYPDTINELKFYRIPLHRPQRFSDNEIFWVVMHYPKEMQYPLPVQFGEAGFGYFLMSRDNGNSFEDGYFYLQRSIVPMFYALSSGNDGAYVFLDPNSGEIQSGETKTANVIVDASNLTEGKHLASLGIITNDIHKPVVNIEVKVNVVGQLPEIEKEDKFEYRAYVNEDNKLSIELKNSGLANLEIYDISSDLAEISKNFEDTIVVKPDFNVFVPFTYSPNEKGLIQTKVILKTNIGDIDMFCEFKVVETPQLNVIANNVVNVIYGEKKTVKLKLQNNGSSTALEYDLKHYHPTNTNLGKIPLKLDYQIRTSADNDGPEDNQWDDISSFATTYNFLNISGTQLDLAMKFPFFQETMDNLWCNQRGQLYFYNDGLLANNPEAEFYTTGKGLLVPLWIKDIALKIKEVQHYSFGDRNVFTVYANVLGGYETGFKPIAEVSYQIVLFKNGAIEFRYKDLSQLKPEWEYTVAIQGLTDEDLLMYKEFDDTNNVLYNGKVIRFEPTSGQSMIVSASPNSGTINPGESVDVNITIDPKAYTITAGTYLNNVLIKTNTNQKNDLFPLTINVIGEETFSAIDTVDFGTVHLGFDTEKFGEVRNDGSANGFLTEVSFDNTQFSLTDELPLELNALAARPLGLKFKPNLAVESKATMTLHFNDGTQKNVVLLGNSVQDPEYALTDPSNIIVNLNGGEKTSLPLSFQNFDKGVELSYSFKNNWFAKIVNGEGNNEVASDKNVLDSEFGYWWNVSDSIKPFYKWEDITDESEKLIVEQGNQKRIELPFEFPFFGELFSTIWVSKNGYVTVIEPENDDLNLEFVKEDGLRGMIAPFWSVLNDPDNNNGIKLKIDDKRIILQWDNFTPFMDPGKASFQLEIVEDGSIYFHYKDVESWGYILNYGLESPDESEVLETERSLIIAYSIISNKSSIAFIPPLNNTLESGQTKELDLIVSAERIYKSGTYNDTIELFTNSVSQAVRKIPVQLNVTGAPILKGPNSLSWENVIFQDELKLTKKITLTNVGYEILSIKQVANNQLEDLTLYNEAGDKLVKTSSGLLLSPIEIKPWETYTLTVEIPVSKQLDVAGEISFLGNFTTLKIPLTASIVDSPIFSWTATNQEFYLTNTQIKDYQFSISNKGETPLKYSLIPAVVPTGDSGDLPYIIEETGNYTLNPPTIVNSFALDKKEAADGVFTPYAVGANLAFSNRFVAPAGGFFLTHLSAYNYLEAVGEYLKIMVHVGGADPQAGEKIFEQKYVIDSKVNEEWMFFPLEKPVNIAEGEVFYVTITAPVCPKYMGYENTNDVSLLENSFTGVYRSDEQYYWYNQYTQSQPVVWKIRPLTAAGEDSWIKLDNYGGELGAGESVNVVATINALQAGKGEHTAKIIAQSNDLNNASNNIDINLRVNGAPEFVYYPNIYSDTVRLSENEELTLNYLIVDPEKEKIDISIQKGTQGPELELKQVAETTAQVFIKTDYESEGIYSYPVVAIDESGSTSSDTLVIKVLDKNRAPVFNTEYSEITLNISNPESFTIYAADLYTDADGDNFEVLAGNYNPEMVDMALGSTYIHLSPLSVGTATLVFAADDRKEDGFVVNVVYVQVIDDPNAVNASPNSYGDKQKSMLGETQDLLVYPNPVVNGNCNIVYKVAEQADVVIEIYDFTGRIIESIQEPNVIAGEHRKTLNLNHLGRGVFHCRYLVSGELIDTKKIIVL